MNKYTLSSLLRKIGLIKIADKMMFYVNYIKTYRLRKQFFRENSDVKLPPAYYIYETFGLNYFNFYNGSAAKWLINHFEKYKKLENINILDWGCGSGRVIRHLPSFIDNSCKLYGTDYNQKYINWCNKNIMNVSFSTNKLVPPLSYESNTFDIIYGISVFTHLSKEMHFAWFDELLRVLKPGGIMLFTLQGGSFKGKLAEVEKIKFEKGELVVKSNTKEGHRTFSAFQPVSFVKELVEPNEVLEYIQGDIKNGKPQQDVWIIKKSS
ncbi:class I SAM-dependent methyltransferase [Bacteroidales bacterium OttesenSCG-928-B11]|nr:class I SAM-dependent methyltransferase [Bacteroidales bacterium OttesenSCG-928-C03]MDL2312654.1 class I SAM-dependent methyltransferase [Bacteroidales bacterium OttesenSCG-928-B11]MDL2326125.1 class I SAM-dependent methyltransferase [Bacteroidales bacterium OttesenSCG-928-A14]